MKGKHLAALTAALIATSSALAGTYEWTDGWGMGVTEYSVDDGNNNSLVIACPGDESQSLSANASIAGKEYYSGYDLGFDVIVDGENYTNPFYTECNFCRAQFDVFWKALRNANHLKLTADGQTVNLPTRNLKELLLPLGAPENSCRSTW